MATRDLRTQCELSARDLTAAGPHQVTWNGRDDEGRLVASGVYLLRLETDGQAYTQGALFLR